MSRAVCLLIHLIFSLCIIGVGKPSTNIDETNSHLEAYSTVNKTHHDNIDDSSQEHHHSHKHSQDDEEHEHNHEHIKIAQHEMKALNQVNCIEVNIKESKSTQIFFEKHLTSSPHLLELFRPPIA